MLRRSTRVAPSDYETPKKAGLKGGKRSNHQHYDDDGISPEKKDCLKTPGTLAAESLSNLSMNTPSTRSRRNLKGEEMADILKSQKKSPGRPARNIFNSKKEAEEEEEKPSMRMTRSRSKSPARQQHRVQFAASPQAVLQIEDGDANIEMEEEDVENVRPEKKAGKKLGRPPKKTEDTLCNLVQKMEVDEEKEAPKAFAPEKGFLTITPMRLKKCGVDKYRISKTPKTPITLRAPTAARRSAKKKVVEETEESEEEEETDSDASEELGEEALPRRRGKTSRAASVGRPTAATPKTPRRKKTASTLEDLRSFLHTSEVPERMPCREEEFKRIRQFVMDSIKPNGYSQAMYISGVPGTGKTATTQAVVNELSKKNDFFFVAVNAMELIEPKQLFVEIYKGIVDDQKRISANAARKKLNTMFEMVSKKRKPVVLLVDELDMLCTKRQEILYDIFNWTSTEGARVSVIAIANTLDLPERMLSQRITSRLGSNRIVFQPYTHEQIKDIVSDRLSNAPDVVRSDAIELAARKVANVTGDLRKAMDILRRAIEIAVEKGEGLLTCDHVNAANREATSVPRVAMVEALSRHAFLLFRAAVSQVQSSGVEEFMFCELYRQYRVLCTQLEGINPFHDYGMHHILMELCSNRLLVAAPGANFPRRKIRLGTTTQEAQFAIKQADDAIKSGKIKYTL